MKKVFKRISKIISSAIFVILIMLIILIVGYIIRIRYLASNNRLGEVKINFYTILTQSMYPTIEAGDIIITYKNDDNRYNPGDIITFSSTGYSDDITITHRVTEIYDVNGEVSYRTKGDNNNSEDMNIVSSEKVIGRVIFRIPKAGYIQQFLVTKTGWIAIVVLPCLGIIIYDIIKIFILVLKKGSNKKLVETKDVLESKGELNKVIDNLDSNEVVDDETEK